MLVCLQPAAAVDSQLQSSPAQVTKAELAKTFAGYEAAFVLLDLQSGKYFRYNETQCSKRFSPCSTFKIFNALVGLETGILKDENQSMAWDGTNYAIASWNHDQTLQSAVANSVVWYFQRLASEVGPQRMQKFVDAAHYGNQDISGGIDKFWLGSSLKISAEEEVALLKRLVIDDLPFSQRSMAIVRGLLKLSTTEKGTLYGKTGSNHEQGKDVMGWFVGYVVTPFHVYIFATNIQAADGAQGKKARQLTETILAEDNLL
jgi:bla regulator protein BlaR1